MIVLVAFGAFIVIASFFFNVDRWALYLIPWFIVCFIICGVRWDYVEDNDEAASYLVRSYCETENEVKFAACIGTTLTHGLDDNFGARFLIIPAGDKYIISYQKLEPILGIPLAVYWSNILFFFLILKLFSMGRWKKKEAEEDT